MRAFNSCQGDILLIAYEQGCEKKVCKTAFYDKIKLS